VTAAPTEFADGYRLGWHSGYEVGWGAAYTAVFDRSAWLAGEPVGIGPSRTELQRARAATDDPCRQQCGRCSSCIRSVAVAANMARFGQVDYPGRSGQRVAS